MFILISVSISGKLSAPFLCFPWNLRSLGPLFSSHPVGTACSLARCRALISAYRSLINWGFSSPLASIHPYFLDLMTSSSSLHSFILLISITHPLFREEGGLCSFLKHFSNIWQILSILMWEWLDSVCIERAHQLLAQSKMIA